MQWITNRTFNGELASMVGGFTVPETLKVWKEATEEEKAELKPLIVSKWLRWQGGATRAEIEPYQSAMNEVIGWKATRPIKARKRFSIRGTLK